MWIPTDIRHPYYGKVWVESEKKQAILAESRKTGKSAESRKPRKRTLRAITGYSRAAVERQLETSNAIDSKLTWVFAAGAVVIGLAAAAVRDTGGSLVSTGLLAAGGAAFLVAAFATTNGLWPRKWKIGAEPPWLYDECRDMGSGVVDHDVAWAFAIAYPMNAALLEGKAKCLQRAVIAAAVEVAVVASAVAYGSL